MEIVIGVIDGKETEDAVIHETENSNDTVDDTKDDEIHACTLLATAGKQCDDAAQKMDLSFKATRKFNLWTFPIETVSQSESGLERTYQGTSGLFWWPLELAAGQKQKITLEFKLTLA